MLFLKPAEDVNLGMWQYCKQYITSKVGRLIAKYDPTNSEIMARLKDVGDKYGASIDRVGIIFGRAFDGL